MRKFLTGLVIAALVSAALIVTAYGQGTSRHLTGMTACTASAVYDASTNGATQLVALAAGKTIYVCGYTLFSGGVANVSLVYGTGANCVTGQTAMTPAFQLGSQVGVDDASSYYRGMATAAGNALCIKTSAGVAVQALVFYTQF